MSLSPSSAFRLFASGAFRPASGHSLLSNLAVSFSFSDEDRKGAHKRRAMASRSFSSSCTKDRRT